MERSDCPKVSVIAPVYGVERHIGRAVESMMEQTLDDVEFIFVDDATPDRSIDVVREVVARYPGRTASVRIIAHEKNRGLPAARNTGLDAARGEYVFHWDSDDYAEPEMLAEMYAAAKRGGCDYVWADWLLTFAAGARRMKQPEAATPREALTAALNGSMRYNVWNKLVARELYVRSGVRFPEGRSMGEDMTMVKLLVNARSVGYVPRAMYHYIRTNAEAMTQIYSERHLRELRENTADLCSYVAANVADGEIEREISWFKLNVKLPFLFSGRKEDLALWRRSYPEADRHIMDNRSQALRTRLLQWTAAHGMTFVNRLYYVMVQKLIYGIIYR